MDIVLDLAYAGAILLFFIITWLFALACDKLGAQK
jgi:hypothetical protein